jgi:uncharacterized spore protein YtfJ
MTDRAPTPAAAVPGRATVQTAIRVPIGSSRRGFEAREWRHEEPGAEGEHMNGEQAAQASRKIMSARRVFGEPIERDGITVIPAARIRGGAGGRNGKAAKNGNRAGGFRVSARPAGVYVIRDGKVRWMPALDVNRIVVGGQIVGAIVAAVAIAVFRPRRPHTRHR